MRRLTATLLATVTAATVVTSLAAPAQAGSAGFKDKRGDAAAATDITRYKVTNGARIGVRVHVRHLSKKTSDIQWWMGTPEASDYQFHAYATLDGRTKLLLTNGSDGIGGRLACSDIRVHRNLRHSWVQLTVPRSCVGASSTDALKARVRVQQGASGAKGDSAPSNSGFTAPVPFS